MKKYLPIIIFVLLAGVIIIVGMEINKNKNNSGTPADNTVASTSNTAADNSTVADNSGIDPVSLAKYLTSKGIIFYGAYWCPHCQEQKKDFGDALQFVTYYECDPKGENSKADACTAAGIESYPTWIINGQKYTGTKTLSELAQLSGYTQ
jgi:glutaredoxin